MKNRRALLLAATAVVVAVIWQLANTPLFGVITGSKHDFGASAWNGTGEICKPCHTPHNARPATEGPLWNHNPSVATYTLYASPTMNGVLSQPSATSKACLSCHDNTVALGAFGGGTNQTSGTIGVLYTAPENLGTDLSNDHPISFTYDGALATADGDLYDPAVKTVPALGGKTITAGMLIGGKLECGSCHDVHAKKGNSGVVGKKLVLVDNAGSALCLTCHNK